MGSCSGSNIYLTGNNIYFLLLINLFLIKLENKKNQVQSLVSLRDWSSILQVWAELWPQNMHNLTMTSFPKNVLALLVEWVFWYIESTRTQTRHSYCSYFLVLVPLKSCWMRCAPAYANSPSQCAVFLSVPFTLKAGKHICACDHVETPLPELSGLIPLVLMRACQGKRRSDGIVCGWAGTKRALFHASS